VIDAALRHAAQGDLVFEEVEQAAEVFAGPVELVLALHYKWMQLLMARVELGLCEVSDTDGDEGDIVAKAWLGLAAAEPVLRHVLDIYEDGPAPALQDALDREHRMLALTAGLVGVRWSDDMVRNVGARWRASLRPGRRSGVCSRGA
jgi:hypothetical protein